MRKIRFAAAALAAVMMFTGCGNNAGSSTATTDSGASSAASEKSVTEKTAAVLDAVEFPEMSAVTSDKLLAYYGIDEADIKEYSAYIAGAGVYPDEFGIFVAVDADAAQRIYDSLTKRIEKQKATYADYSPDEMYKLEDAHICIDGTNVSFAVCADNEAAHGILG